MADVGLDGLFREEEVFPDLAVDEAVCHELQHLDLTSGRILAELSGGRRGERDDGAVPARATACGRRFEAAAVVSVPVEDLLSLGGVHVTRIGAPALPL